MCEGGAKADAVFCKPYRPNKITALGPIYLRDLYSYGVLRTIVLVLETPLANKLFVNTRCQPWRPAAWAVPSPVA